MAPNENRPPANFNNNNDIFKDDETPDFSAELSIRQQLAIYNSRMVRNVKKDNIPSTSTQAFQMAKKKNSSRRSRAKKIIAVQFLEWEKRLQSRLWCETYLERRYLTTVIQEHKDAWKQLCAEGKEDSEDYSIAVNKLKKYLKSKNIDADHLKLVDFDAPIHIQMALNALETVRSNVYLRRIYNQVMMDEIEYYS